MFDDFTCEIQSDEYDYFYDEYLDFWELVNEEGYF